MSIPEDISGVRERVVVPQLVENKMVE